MKIDFKSILGVLTSVLGWVVANGSVVLPILPAKDQATAGTVVGVAGLILTFLAHPPTSTSTSTKA
jgi:hypothetical protein